MTDNEIIKALECCISSSTSLACFKCPMAKNKECNGSNTNVNNLVVENAIDLINRQKAEIERLKKAPDVVRVRYEMSMDERDFIIKQAKSEAIKEFADEIIKTLKDALYGLDIKEKTISKEEVRKRFESLIHKDIPEVIEYVKNKMVGDDNA